MFKLTSKSRQRECTVFLKSGRALQAEGSAAHSGYYSGITERASSVCRNFYATRPANRRCRWPSMSAGLQRSTKYPKAMLVVHLDAQPEPDPVSDVEPV